MNLSKDIDLKTAFNAAKDFELSTGIKCFITDENGETISLDSVNDSNACSFCKILTKFTGEIINCRQTHLYGSDNAIRYGGKYIYFCPLSLTHFTSPLLEDGVVKGALVGGPVLLIDRDDYIQNEILNNYTLNKTDLEKVKTALNKIPQISPERLTSLSQLLMYTSSIISDVKIDIYTKEQLQTSEQSHISDYMHHLNSMGGKETKEYPIEKEKELLRLITIADKKGAQALLNEFLGEVFFSTDQNFDIIKSRILELVVLLSRAAMDGGANIEHIFGLNFNYLKEINQFNSIDTLCEWLTKIVVRFVDYVFDIEKVKYSDTINKTKQYLYAHYTEKLTLDIVAKEVGLSSSYFGKIFREQMKVSFPNYLNTLRIDKSKDLLSNKNIQLTLIAELVGYEDQSYFSKVFKKLTGISPGKYRDGNKKKV